MRIFLLVLVILSSFQINAQNTDSLRHFDGRIQVTNNGISLVPNFSLGRPATIINLSAYKGKFSIEPDIRFSLKAEPWTMLFWARYKLADSKKLKIRTGTHLGLNYKISELPIMGDTTKTNIVRRYWATELAPNYILTPHMSIGLYYLYSLGLDAGTIRNSNFITFNLNFFNLQLNKSLYASFSPQVYFLKQDARSGFYYTSAVNLAKRNFPISLTGLINQRINGNILANQHFLWSIGVVYSFNNTYKIKSKY